MFRDRDLPLRLAAALLPPAAGYTLTRRLTPAFGGARHRHVSGAVAEIAGRMLGDTAAGAAAGRDFAASIACDDLDAVTAFLWPERLRLAGVDVEGDSLLPPPGRAVFVSFHLGGGFRIHDVLPAHGFRVALLSAPPAGNGNRYDRFLARARFSYLRRRLGERLLLVGPGVARADLRSPAPLLASGHAIIALLDVPVAALGLRDTVEANLFGRRIALPAGLLRLAASSDTPVVPFDGRIEGGRRILRFHPAVPASDAPGLATALTAVLERVIRERPGDWQGWLDAERLLGPPPSGADAPEARRVDPAPRPPAARSLAAPPAPPPSRPDPRPDPAEPGHGGARPADVVVPVFDARADTIRCLESVLRAVGPEVRVVVVDDASTDRALSDWLDALAARTPNLLLLRNEENRGFVASANRGLREAIAAGHDACLLNSDTLVPAGFLERLAAAARHTPRTGIVSPLTNNGTLCSVPEFMVPNPLPVGLDTAGFDDLVAATSPRTRPEIFTGVGFCLYLRREVLDACGGFDEERFGRGYGEENDLCERARAAGFEIRLCDDLFVYHRGAASFGDATRGESGPHLDVIAALHPGYHEGVQAFVRANPLAGVHAGIRYHLARRAARRHPAMLFWLHASPYADPVVESMGGTQYHVRDLVRTLALPRAVVAWPEPDAVRVAEIEDGAVDRPRLHRFARVAGPRSRFVLRDAADEALFERIVDLFDVRVAHFHHLLGWPAGSWRTLERRGIPYAFTVHDYDCVCPSWNLLDFDRVERCPCPEATPELRRRCLEGWFRACAEPLPGDPEAALRDHRAEFAALLAGAAVVVAPSDAARAIVARAHPNAVRRWAVIPCGTERPAPHPDRGEPRREGPLRVGLIGAVAAPWKGAAAVLDVLREARGTGIEWHVFGDAEAFGFPERAREAAGADAVHFHGRYRREEIVASLAEHGIDLSLLLSPWDETFCYALGESWAAGIPAIVADRGALAERTRRTGAGLVVEGAAGAVVALRRLAASPEERARLVDTARAVRELTPAGNAARHRAAYGDALSCLAPAMAAPPWGPADRELFAAHRAG